MARRLPHRPGLDRLRGAAVAAVVAYHLGYLRGGFLGVDVFFVLSGFLVTSLLLAEAGAGARDSAVGRRASGIDLVAFWRARFRRLVPAVLVVVPVVLFAARLAGWPRNRLDDLAIDGAATVTWWENWRQILAGTSYWDPSPSPFRHAWSLAIEEQFYVVWPLVVVAVAVLAGRLAGGRRGGRSLERTVAVAATAGVAASASLHLALAHRLPEADMSRVYLGTDTRVFAILAGCALACTRWGLARTVTGPDADPPPTRSTTLMDGGAILAAVVLVWLAVSSEVSDPDLFRRGGFLVAAAASASLAVAVSTPGRSPVRTVAARGGSLLGPPATVLGYLGLRSYGIYLWSWPIQVLAEHRWPDAARHTRSVAVLLVALAVAECSYRWLENPIRRGTGWATERRHRRPAWALGVALPVLAIVLITQAAVPDPIHEDLETDDALEIARTQPTRPTSTTAANGEPVQPPGLHVLVIGDSVAFTIGYYKPGLFEGPEGIDWIDSRSVIGCGLLAASGFEYPKESGGFGAPAGGDCEVQAEVESLGLAEGPDVVVTFPGAWEVFAVRSPDGEVIEPMTDRMAAVQAEAIVARARAAHDAGAAFVVVGWACPGGGTPPERRDPDFIEWFDRTMRGAVERAAAEPGVDARYIAPDEQVCDGGIAGDPTEAKEGWMGDSNHVPDLESGQRLWHEWLGPLLVAEMDATGEAAGG
ncbi:MAG: acyltransferase [Acidimicrobiales bacterium]|nr:acyltransferase [Acidimicrobiales bacterium]